MVQFAIGFFEPSSDQTPPRGLNRNMKLQTILEVFDSGYKVYIRQIGPKAARGVFFDDHKRKFELHADVIDSDKGAWEISFSNDQGTSDLTGYHDALSVFGAVINFAELLSNHRATDIREIRLRAVPDRENSRESVYTRISKRIAPKHGFKFKGKVNGYLILTR